jgi:lysophospholipase L1-like esterase
VLRTYALAAVLLVGSAVAPQAAQAGPGHEWTGTWQTAMSGTAPKTDRGLADHSIRNVVHISVGGTEARIRLSNALGKVPVLMGHVTVAIAARPDAPDAVAGTMRELTFGGAASITIPAGAEAVSDPVRIPLPAQANLLVTTYTPEPSGPVTYHQVANQTSFLSPDGDHAADESGTAFTQRTTSWHYVSAVDVRGGPAFGSVVMLGDSITDGNASTVNTNRRWPDFLSRRLGSSLGVLNAGISSNRLLSDTWNPNALARLDRDVLTATGARSVVVLLGINDIGGQPQHREPAPIIAALRQIAEQARARGLRVLGGTLTPFGGSGNYTAELESVRLAVNEFIRTGGAFDAVVDFDAALRDPADPHRLRPEYDSGDHLHPADAGYQAMATAVHLPRLFLPARPSDRWTGTWQTSMANTGPALPDYSIRNVVHTSLGGREVRVRLSNAFGKVPVLMGHVTVAVAARSDAPDAVAGTMREVTFGGAASITIPPGAEVLSDPVRLTVPEDGDLLVTVFTPGSSGPVTMHPRAYQTSFLAPGGDHAAAESGTAFTASTPAWQYVTGVDVRAGTAQGTVVTFGDSITDGDKSTPNANRRWPDVLADRLAAEPGPTRLGVLNAGISGNRVMHDNTGIGGPNALARLDRDVLTATGARTVVLFVGINDIGNLDMPDASQLIAALRQAAAQARAQGLRVIAGTITPFQGWRSYTDRRESVRMAANDFIRDGGAFDGVIDFDRVVRDPVNPHMLRPEYDSGDHLHPSDAGYRAMGTSVDLRLLK